MRVPLSFLSQRITNWLNREKPPSPTPLSDFGRIRYEVRPCDVILVEGRTRISNVIRWVTQSPWTHAALYIGRLHDIEDPKFRARAADHFSGDPEVQLIIESLLGEGTVLRPLTDYEEDHLRICRPRGLSHRDSQQVINFALSRLGFGYDVRQILDLARFLFPWPILPRRWRSSLFAHNAGRPTRTVCSTMIAEAFAYIQFPILPLVRSTNENEVRLFRRNPRICTPKDFDYSPYFEIIKYPFIDCERYGSYRLLPWHGSATLVVEHGEHSQPAPQQPAGQENEVDEERNSEEKRDDFLIEDEENELQRQRDPLIEEISRMK
ncbi:MAG: lipo-like protein [Pseudomonadales bacterium]|jgi:hypothetical protein